MEKSTKENGTTVLLPSKQSQVFSFQALHPIDYVSISRSTIEDSDISEASILVQLNHPNIVKCFGFYVNEGQKYIILEFMDMGNLNY